MIFAFPVMLFLAVIWVLTLLAWIEGFRTMAAAAESKDDIRQRVLPPMLLLAAPIAILFGFFLLRLGHVVSPALPGRMAIIGAASAFAALLTSIRAPRGFRGLAIAAAMAWLFCFGFALVLLFSLSRLR
jgi:hypothetical protein